MAMADLPVIGIDDADYWQDIYPPLHEALAVSPLARTPDGGLYVLGHDEVDAVLKDKRFEAADLLAMMGLDSGPVWEWWSRMMFSNNDPIHGRIRRLVNRAFTPKPVEQKRGMIRGVARQLVADAVDQGSVDVMTTVAHHLPSMVMANLLAIPEADRQQFAEWTTDIGLAFGAAGDAAVRARVEAALAGLDAYVEHLVTERRQHLGTDLLSELIGIEEAGDRLSTRELIDLIENLLFAGHDTTRGAVGVVLVQMVAHPEVRASVTADRRTAVQIVEEVLRYEAITYTTSRMNREPVEIAGVEIPEGTPVGLCLPAASRDGRHYPDPDRFDITRTNINPPTFGAGAHYCIGAWLARAELQELILAVADLTTSIDVEVPPRWTPFAHIRRYEALHMRFDAA